MRETEFQLNGHVARFYQATGDVAGTPQYFTTMLIALDSDAFILECGRSVDNDAAKREEEQFSASFRRYDSAE